MNNKEYKIAKTLMFDNDLFSQWLGIDLIEIKPGYCALKMSIREEMTNGFKISHGGITYSLADSALAFASNSHGRMALSIETSISHLVKVKVGDELIAIANETNRNDKIGLYEVEVRNQENILVAKFKGTVYFSNKEWEIKEM
ncbi:MAG: hotdog fold thioesterase [Bacteroidota bacterium]|jgi:acyl-CoA thioesterase